MSHRIGTTLILAFIAASLLSAGVVRAEEELVDNPAYKSWAPHQPETTVTHEMKMNTGGMEFTTEMTQKLVELTEENAVVEIRTKTQMMGQTHQSPPQRQTHAARVPESEVNKASMPPEMKGTIKETGSETITVNGTEYTCKVFEISSEHQGASTNGKAWMTEEVPGTLVKTEFQSQGGPAPMSMVMQLVSIDAK